MAKQCSICEKTLGKFEKTDGIFGVFDICSSCISEVKQISANANIKDYRSYFNAKDSFYQKYKSSPNISALLTNMDKAYDIKNAASAIYEQCERESEYAAQQAAREEAYSTLLKIRDFPVTTVDINEPYEIVGPIIANTTNKGVFSSAFSKLLTKYSTYPMEVLLKKPSNESKKANELGTFLFSLFDPSLDFEGVVGQRSFDMAYYICIAELKLRCAEIGGNAIVGMHMDFDLDTNNWAGFYIQMHGTAVKLKEE